MISFNDFEILSEDVMSGVHDFGASGDTIKAYLTNTAPNASTHAVKADLAGITEQNGYAAADIQNTLSRTGSVTTIGGTDVVITATGAVGPFRYAVLYNSTTTVKTDPLISYYDYGSSISLSDGESFMIDIGDSILVGQFS